MPENPKLAGGAPAIHGRPVRLYLAGPMRKYPADYNFPAFHAARDRLRTAGYHVESPADLDLLHGFDPAQHPVVTAERKREFIRRDVCHICDCDGVALLDKWEDSAGVRIEIAVAEFCEIPCMEVATWVKWAEQVRCTILGNGRSLPRAPSATMAPTSPGPTS